MDMLAVLKRRLPEGLKIVSHRELAGRYVVVYEYEGVRTRGGLSKISAPGRHREEADFSIATAMAAIQLSLGNLVEAKRWLDRDAEEFCAQVKHAAQDIKTKEAV